MDWIEISEKYIGFSQSQLAILLLLLEKQYSLVMTYPELFGNHNVQYADETKILYNEVKSVYEDLYP